MIRVYALSGSHDVGKTTIFTRLKRLLRSYRFAFVGEFADCLLKQMGIRDAWKETICLLYTSPSPRDLSTSRMPSSA